MFKAAKLLIFFQLFFLVYNFSRTLDFHITYLNKSELCADQNVMLIQYYLSKTLKIHTKANVTHCIFSE